MTVTISCWQSPSNSLALADWQVHLWRFRLDHLAGCLKPSEIILSVDERKRAERLLIAEKRQQFVASRIYLRNILSRYLTLAPEEIVFSYGESGKPSIESGSNGFHFNLAHSGRLGVLAVSKSAEVGVDIEKIDHNLGYLSLSCRYFNDNEKKLLNTSPIHRRRRVFYRLWTQKESWLKQLGTGFSEPNKGELNSILTRNFPVAKNYLAALSCSEKPNSILRFQTF